MEETLHHLECIKPCKQWDIVDINWCRISSINSFTNPPTNTLLGTITYPTWGTARSSTQKCQKVGDMLVPWMVFQIPENQQEKKNIEEENIYGTY